VAVGPEVIVWLALSIVLVALWADYTAGAVDAYRQRRTEAMLRELLVTIMVLATAIGLSLTQLAALTPPPTTRDEVVVTLLAAGRFMLLAVGIWLYRSRRRRRTY
jgi:hypothetical protein